MAIGAAVRSVFRSSTVRSAATRLASQAKSSPFRRPSATPLPIPRTFRMPVELSACVESILPYHSVTASALMVSMLTVPQFGCGWLPEDH